MLLSLAVFGMLAAAALQTFGGEPTRFHLDTSGPRALATALHVLSETLNVPITFEEPTYDDNANTEIWYPGFMGIRRERISFDYDPVADPELVVKDLLVQYSSSRDAHKYVVSKSRLCQEVLDVRPVEKRTSTGTMVLYRSLLDVPIALSDISTQNYYAAVTSVCARVERDGMTLGVGPVPAKAFAREQPVWSGVAPTSALECLDFLMGDYNRRFGGRLSWKIYCSAGLGGCALNLSQTTVVTNPLQMSVIDVRAIPTALALLEEHLDCTVVYEDPPFLCPCEVMRNKDGQPEMPRGGYVEFSFSPRQEPLEVIQALLSAYERQGNSSRFAVTNVTGNVFGVFPVEGKDKDGNPAPVSALMNMPVDIVVQSNSLAGALEGVARDLARAAQVRVEVGRLQADSALPRSAKRFSEHGLPFRESFTRFLREVDKEMSWQLLYEPKRGTYLLNVVKASNATGSTINQRQRASGVLAVSAQGEGAKGDIAVSR